MELTDEEVQALMECAIVRNEDEAGNVTFSKPTKDEFLAHLSHAFKKHFENEK